jgi:hypothetical protein
MTAREFSTTMASGTGMYQALPLAAMMKEGFSTLFGNIAWEGDMSGIERSPEEMSIDQEHLFSPEGLPYWLQFPPEMFIRMIVNYLRTHNFRVEKLAEFIRENPEAAKIDMGEGMTVEDVCERISASTSKTEAILATAVRYAFEKSPEEPPE